MFKYLFTLFLIVTFLPTSAIDLVDGPVSIEDFEMEYLVDNDNKLTIDTVRNKAFIPINNRTSLGDNNDTTWHRVTIKNTSSRVKKVFLHSQLSYLEFIANFYDVRDNQVSNRLLINLRDKEDAVKKMAGATAIFPISLEASESTTVYINTHNKPTRMFSFTLYDEKSSNESLVTTTVISSILSGILLTITIYHLVFSLFIRRKPYLYYVLYLVSSTILGLQLSGFLANTIGFYYSEMNDYFLISLVTMPLFLTLLIKSIFNTNKQYKYENIFLNTVVAVFTIALVFSFFNILEVIRVTTYYYIYFFIIIIGVSISLLVKGDSFAKYFLPGTSLYIFFTVITDIYYMGLLPYNIFIFHAGYIGMILEAIMLSMIMSYTLKKEFENAVISNKDLENKNWLKIRNKNLKKKVSKAISNIREKDQLIFQQNKLASMGKMLENIAHQWRQPLNQINSSILLMDNYLGEKDKSDAVISSYLDQIEAQTLHMSETIDNFRHYYHGDIHSAKTTLKKSIENTVALLQATLSIKGISLKMDIEYAVHYRGTFEEIQQALIAILSNAIDALSISKSVTPLITISVRELDSNFIIDICDTAGGINELEINQVFDKYYSSKDEAEYGGLGLYISKKILERNHLGSLSVSNNQAGACFRITLFKRDQL